MHAQNTCWLIKNGRIIDPANQVDRTGDLLVHNGYITEAKQNAALQCQEIDASGLWVVPGLTDMHVHLREPGQEYKEDILTGALAAAAGGFTGIACMPNTSPPNDCRAVTAMILARAESAAARVYPVGCLSKGLEGKQLAEYGELKEAGVVALTDDGKPVSDSQLMRRALEYASDFGLPVISHCEEEALSRGVMHEGAVSTRLGLKGSPAAAESVMVYRDIALAECTGRRVHIAHVSTAMAVGLIRAAKARGVPVTAETAPHYFTLTEEAVEGYNTNAKMNPPLRTAADREAIRQGLADGTIDAIATDHAPHSILEKETEFDIAANGIIGLETAVSLTLELVRQGVLDVQRMIELLAVNPARLLQLPAGTLSVGTAADITIIDPEREFVYTLDQVVSKSHNSPFLDQQLKGRAVLTMVDGAIRHNLLF